MESKNRYNKLVNISKKKKKVDTDMEDKLVVARGRGKMGCGSRRHKLLSVR